MPKKIMSVQVLMNSVDPEKGNIVEKAFIPFDDFIYLFYKNDAFDWSESKVQALKAKYPDA